MKTNIILLLIGIAALTSCKKESNPDPPYPQNRHSLSFSFKYDVDGLPLIFDSLMYVNDAGNHYRVSSLVYFLSEVSLLKQDSSKIKLCDYQYLDASLSSTNLISIDNPPTGSFIGICFNIGVDSVHNCHGGLPNNMHNNNMEWPEAMGGGYHVMKFEGYFADDSNLPGFAMHLGTNECLVPVKLYYPITITESNITFTLSMNLNEWFRNPAIYNLNTDGNYTMGNMMLMSKLSSNGKDVFHF